MNNKKIVLASNNKKKMKEMTELMGSFRSGGYFSGKLEYFPG